MADFNRDGRVDSLRAAPPGVQIDFGDGAGSFAQHSYALTIPGTDFNDKATSCRATSMATATSNLPVMLGGGHDDQSVGTARAATQAERNAADWPVKNVL